MKKPVIAVDIDEVLIPLHEHFLDYHNIKYGTDFHYPDSAGRYHLQEFTGESNDIAFQKLHEFYKAGNAKHLQPLPGAVSAIKRLKQEYDLVIVSNQQLFQSGYTKLVLQQYFGNAFEKMYFTGALPHRHSLTKPVICKKIAASYLIDDNVSAAINCAAEGIKVVLFGDYHWNRADKLAAGVIRCKGWDEVLEYFDDQKR